jgi:hypothetical protein
MMFGGATVLIFQDGMGDLQFKVGKKQRLKKCLNNRVGVLALFYRVIVNGTILNLQVDGEKRSGIRVESPLFLFCC